MLQVKVSLQRGRHRVESGSPHTRHRAHVARLYPTPAQVQKFDRQGHTARALWNLLHEWHGWGGRGGSVAKRPSPQDIPQAADLRVVRVNRRWGEVTVLLVGRVKFRWTRPIPVTTEACQGRITGARLLKDPLGWHICFRIQEPEVAVAPRADPAIGIDLGVVHTMRSRTGETSTCLAS